MLIILKYIVEKKMNNSACMHYVAFRMSRRLKKFKIVNMHLFCYLHKRFKGMNMIFVNFVFYSLFTLLK